MERTKRYKVCFIIATIFPLFCMTLGGIDIGGISFIGIIYEIIYHILFSLAPDLFTTTDLNLGATLTCVGIVLFTIVIPIIVMIITGIMVTISKCPNINETK